MQHKGGDTLKQLADSKRNVCAAEFFGTLSSACLRLFPPDGGGGSGEVERHKELLRQFSANQCGFGSFKDFIPSVYYL